ncbi:hypothetical protein CMQ_852 [Grosmannia clavigera kw1407]|uniref:Uncharacterized protein n=1 Tax=Grosmannia clavigera (strain kw1407 / UAMH 11150) TaxID=655863 RepID=F0XCB5_GROCL|nr:uncharacterized protein CMQ_852 [Grosmannia clavigera kw1407]EFX03924.1 hypothetical protein CMQ_852 [Grosmannia clavigera kw1407]
MIPGLRDPAPDFIRKHTPTSLAFWFGNLISAWARSVYHSATEAPFRSDDGSYHPSPIYGDGEQIEAKYLNLAIANAESTQVLVRWRQGDFILLDKYNFMHSRSP